MSVKIAINCDNAAFEQNDGADEVCRILRALAERVSEYGTSRAYGNILDFNGNKVGEVCVEE